MGGTTPTLNKQATSEMVMELMSQVRERINQVNLELAQLDRDTWELGRRINQEIEQTDPRPPANVIRFAARDAA